VAAVDMDGKWKNKMVNKDTTNMIRKLPSFVQPFIDINPSDSEAYHKFNYTAKFWIYQLS
jgi:hypothetical protein